MSASFNSALPVISMYIFAGYRLLPALQIIYGAFTNLTFAGPSLDKLHEEFKKFKFRKCMPYKNGCNTLKKIADSRIVKNMHHINHQHNNLGA